MVCAEHDINFNSTLEFEYLCLKLTCKILSSAHLIAKLEERCRIKLDVFNPCLNMPKLITLLSFHKTFC